MADRILVKIKSSEDKTSGGILLPTSAQSKPQGGEVVAIGEGRTIGKNKVDISVQVPLQVRSCLFVPILMLATNSYMLLSHIVSWFQYYLYWLA